MNSQDNWLDLVLGVLLVVFFAALALFGFTLAVAGVLNLVRILS